MADYRFIPDGGSRPFNADGTPAGLYYPLDSLDFDGNLKPGIVGISKAQLDAQGGAGEAPWYIAPQNSSGFSQFFSTVKGALTDSPVGAFSLALIGGPIGAAGALSAGGGVVDELAGGWEAYGSGPLESTVGPWGTPSLMNGFSPTTFADSFVSGTAEDAGIMSGNAANYAAASGAVPGAAGELVSSASWLDSIPRLPNISLPRSTPATGGLTLIDRLFSASPGAQAATPYPYGRQVGVSAPYGLNAPMVPVAGNSTLMIFAVVAAGVAVIALAKRGK